MTQEEIDDFVRNCDTTKLMCHYEEEDCDPWTTYPVRQASGIDTLKKFLRLKVFRRWGTSR